MVVDLRLIGIGLMIRNAVFIGKIVDDRRIRVEGSLIEQIRLVRRQQSAQAIVPRAFADTIPRVDLLSIFIRHRAEKSPPRFGACTGHTLFGDRRANLVRTTKPGSRTRFAKP